MNLVGYLISILCVWFVYYLGYARGRKRGDAKVEEFKVYIKGIIRNIDLCDPAMINIAKEFPNSFPKNRPAIEWIHHSWLKGGYTHCYQKIKKAIEPFVELSQIK